MSKKNSLYKGIVPIVGLFLLIVGVYSFQPLSKMLNTGVSSIETSETPCQGYKDCSYEVRQKLEGAGWQLAGDVLYYGNGVHYAVGAKPMETGVKQIYYTMDCNCQPKDVELK
ncbi:hypothetical protein N9O99_02175 [Schleiferiaceae bacterium]|nr:hypothetical protein [Schleiferiaceae bacterium]